ncbi:TKL/IRAK protein kinase [Capsaspora owczarzaki ATCC 30864]|uniref:TKL/IRAK protein kinase n=1 Tax=Capsaspora owczarzaki (strain ATCC 30864) TaxID=595528 RepID=A0A0D2WSZ6_CAPO3|nr:TKL/IRAK protein kinase [Capsaspora owczarzaki ATCC 30864]
MSLTSSSTSSAAAPSVPEPMVTSPEDNNPGANLEILSAVAEESRTLVPMDTRQADETTDLGRAVKPPIAEIHAQTILPGAVHDEHSSLIETKVSTAGIPSMNSNVKIAHWHRLFDMATLIAAGEGLLKEQPANFAQGMPITPEQQLVYHAKERSFSVESVASMTQPASIFAQPFELDAKDQELEQLRHELAAKYQELAARDQKLAARDQELVAREQELVAREQELVAREQELTAKESRIDNQPLNSDGHIPQIPLATLLTATNNFAADSLLGEGTFSRVYGASLPVAIKRLPAELIQHYVEFQSELESLSKFRHPNIVAILSYANSHDEYCLVYEFMPNGSVRDRLDRKNGTPPLTWYQRHRIAAGVARGMNYVQTAFPDHVLILLDLTTDNVLLDASLEAKVSNFGLARAAQHLHETSYLPTPHLQGTKVYMCPEFFAESKMTVKTDVYAFGMILLELVTAEKASIRMKSNARKAVKNQTINDMLDPVLILTEAECQSIHKIVVLALECLEEAAEDRPSFGTLLATLDH